MVELSQVQKQEQEQDMQNKAMKCSFHDEYQCLYEGSVKNVWRSRLNPAAGEYFFQFTDDYSIFDWGKMPDQIPKKGEVLAQMTSLLFRQLARKESWIMRKKSFEHLLTPAEKTVLEDLCQHGLNTHFLGDGRPEKNQLNHREEKSWIRVQAVDVKKPEWQEEGWSYAAYSRERPVQTLVPLEVIFRFGIPSGSSLIGRLEDQNYMQQFTRPRDYENFALRTLWPRPLIEFSTKLEEQDRFVTYEQAQAMAGMNDEEWTRFHTLSVLLAFFLKDIFTAMGLELWDGKFEWAFDRQRDFMLVDAMGLDEMRLLKQSVQLSKEMLRQHYQHTEWLQRVQDVKKLALVMGERDWKKLFHEKYGELSPPLLPAELVARVSAVYCKVLDDLLFSIQGKDAYGLHLLDWSDILGGSGSVPSEGKIQ